MNNKIIFALMGIGAFSMSSCTTMGDKEYLTYPTYTYDVQPYNLNNYNMISYDYKYQQKQDVVVPDSYHMSEFHSPVSFKERDQTWVNSQNPQAYTIELVEGDKPSKVAQTLYKAPKNERMAQVKYDRDGKTYYKGIYGTYSTAAEAQKALNALPIDFRNSASVVQWNNVQQ